MQDFKAAKQPQKKKKKTKDEHGRSWSEVNYQETIQKFQNTRRIADKRE